MRAAPKAVVEGWLLQLGTTAAAAARTACRDVQRRPSGPLINRRGRVIPGGAGVVDRWASTNPLWLCGGRCASSWRGRKAGRKRSSAFWGGWGAERRFQAQAAHRLPSPGGVAKRAAALHAATHCRQLGFPSAGVDVSEPVRLAGRRPGGRQLQLRPCRAAGDQDFPQRHWSAGRSGPARKGLRST